MQICSKNIAGRCRFVPKKYLKDADLSKKNLADFERQVAGGESQPCKAFVDNGGETSPEIVSQNTF